MMRTQMPSTRRQDTRRRAPYLVSGVTFASTMIGIGAVVVLSACSEAPTTPAQEMNGSVVVGHVRVDPEAAVIAAGGTQQLTTTVTALDGTPITTYDTIQYVSLDSSKVTVSSAGLVTARTGSRAATDAPVGVAVLVTQHGVTQTDTAYIAVVETAGSSPTFSMADASSGDKVAVGDFKSVTPSITYFDGSNTVTLQGYQVPINIRVEQPALAMRTSPTSFKPILAQGQVTISATVVVFGTPLTDSVTYSLGDPASVRIYLSQSGLTWQQQAGSAFSSSAVFYLQTGGELDVTNFASIGTHTVGLTCTASGSGVAPPPVTGLTTNYSSAAMVFTMPGTYACDWTSDGVPGFPTDGSLHFSIVVR